MDQILLDQNGIKKYIPHRFPFLFLDQISRIDLSKPADLVNFSIRDLAGSSVTATFTTSFSHPLYTIHNSWPSVLHIEAMAQAACFVLNCFESSYGSSKLQVALLSLDGMRFHAQVGADALLLIKSTCTKIRGNIATFSASILKDEELVAEGTFMASFSFSPNDAHAPGSHTDSQFT